MDNTKKEPQRDKVFIPFGIDLASFLVCKGHTIFAKVCFSKSINEKSCMFLIGNNKSLFSDMNRFYEDNVMDKCIEYVNRRLGRRVNKSFSINHLFETRKKLLFMPVMVKNFKGFAQGNYPEKLFCGDPKNA